VTGIDASSDLIEVAQHHAKLDPSLDDRLNYIHTAAETHVNEASGKYDAVVSSEVIEHIHDKDFFLEQCVRLLKVLFQFLWCFLSYMWLLHKNFLSISA